MKLIHVLRNTYFCQGKGSWLKIQTGMTCILLMAFWREPNEDGFNIGINLFSHGSNRFGLWIFSGRKNNAAWYWCSSLLAVLLLSGCSASQRETVRVYKDKDGNVVKETRTVTETVKEEKRVPDYHTETHLRSRTSTTPGSEPLHTVQIKSAQPAPQPAGAVILDAK